MSAAAPTPQHVLSTWSKQQDETIRRMARDGKSASEIALAIGKSRSAVLGRAWRKGIKMGSKLRPGQNSPDPKAFIKPRNKPGKRVRVAPASPQRAKLPTKDGDGLSKDRIDAAFSPTCAPEQSRKITLLELEAGMCKWPLFTSGEQLFCGAETGEKLGKLAADELRPNHKIYCTHHAALAVSKNQRGNGM